VVEHLSRKNEALSLIPSITKKINKNEKKKPTVSNSVVLEWDLRLGISKMLS
jgi:hypothetical protein